MLFCEEALRLASRVPVIFEARKLGTIIFTTSATEL